MPAQIVLIPPIESCLRRLRLEMQRRTPVGRQLDPYPLALLITYGVCGDDIPIPHRLKIARAVCRLLAEESEPEDRPPGVA